jgi:hypothetical protein
LELFFIFCGDSVTTTAARKSSLHLFENDVGESRALPKQCLDSQNPLRFDPRLSLMSAGVLPSARHTLRRQRNNEGAKLVATGEAQHVACAAMPKKLRRPRNSPYVYALSTMGGNPCQTTLSK